MKPDWSYKKFEGHPMLHTGYRETTEQLVGTEICTVCGKEGQLILRRGLHFRNWKIDCPNGHRPQIKKELIDVFCIGDRIRYYKIDFGGKLHWDHYTEGIIIAKKPGIIAYRVTYKIDKVVISGKISKQSWLNDHIIEINSDTEGIELLTPQVCFDFDVI